MIIFDNRPRNAQGQFSGESSSGIDPQSMAAAYGGAAQKSQSALQRIAIAMKLRQPVQPENNPMLSSIRNGMISMGIRPRPVIIRNRKGGKLRKIYGLGESLGGTEEGASAPAAGNFSSASRSIQFAQFHGFPDGSFTLHRVVGGPIKKGHCSGWFDAAGKLMDAEHKPNGISGTARAVQKNGPMWQHIQHHGKTAMSVKGETELSSLSPGMISLGIGADLLSKASGFLLRNPLAKTGLIGAGVGAIGGAGRAAIHNAVDSNPQDHQSVIGNALGGAAVGGAAGLAGGYLAGQRMGGTGMFQASKDGTSLAPHMGPMPSGNPRSVQNPAELSAVESHPDFAGHLYASPAPDSPAIPTFKDGNGGSTFTYPGVKQNPQTFGPAFSKLERGMIRF
jgi:hypothetical protein